MSKTLAVCGDSWFSSDLRRPGQSFGEVLSSTYGYKLLSLARGGCSNFAINLQVKKAIELKADIVIVGATTPDRIELPIIANNLSYDVTRGLSNIKYFPGVDLGGSHNFLTNPTIMSESLNNLAFHGSNSEYYQDLLTAEQIESLKQYMVNLYDSEIKRQYDIWSIYYACSSLIDKKIPFLLYTSHLYSPAYFDDLQRIPKANRIDHEEFNFLQFSSRLTNTRFHYPPQESKSIADYFQSRIEKLL